MNKYDMAIKMVSLPQCEGLKLTPYLCAAGVPTIGIGTTSYPNGIAVTMKDPSITKEQAVEYCTAYFQKNIFPKIDHLQPQFHFQDWVFTSLCSLAYNIPKAIRGDSILNALLNSDLEALAIGFRNYNKIYKNGEYVICQGLVTRREIEIKYFMTGELPK